MRGPRRRRPYQRRKFWMEQHPPFYACPLN
nr:MAG TPA: hypothetical protein [Caudoviricetes sp.]